MPVAMGLNSSIIALDLIITAILTYIQENKEEIDAMPPEEFKEFSAMLQSRRKAWMGKYSR